jgi:hypothetical protein
MRMGMFEMKRNLLAGLTLAAMFVALAVPAVASAAPTVTIDEAPRAVSNSSQATFTFSGGEDAASFECLFGRGITWDACESPVLIVGLTDGQNAHFEVRALDTEGIAGDPATHDWTVDLTAPVVSFTETPPSLASSPAATFEFTIDDPDATVECRLDPGPETEWTGCDSPQAHLGLGDGSHTFEVRATDVAGNVSELASHEWWIDTIVPTVEITGAPAPISAEGNPSFTFVADEPGTFFECRLDPADETANWASCESPVSYPGLAEGEHRFEVRATDTAGHVGEPATHVWTVETTAPVATITSGPSGTTTEITAHFGFATDNENASFECRLDSADAADWAPCASGVEYDNLSDGEHRFEVRAVGQGAGPGPVASRTWSIDTVAPSLTIASAPNQPTNETEATFEVVVNKPGYTLECQIDAEPAEPCESPVTYTGLVPGEHSFVVRALDADGEVVDSGVWQWTILAGSPAVTVTEGPAAASSSKTAVFHFTKNVPEAVSECRIDSGAWSVCTSPAAYPNLGDGPHTFEVRSFLPGSEAGETATRQWTVDTTAPALTVAGGPSGPTTATGAHFTITADDEEAAIECSLDGGAWADCAGNAAFNGLADGDHALRIRAVDPVGNTGLARRDWSVDATAPVTTLRSVPDNRTTAFNARFTFNANEPGATFECRLDGGEWKACSSAHQVRNLSRGSHAFAVRATDRLGNTGQAATHAWRIVPPAPKGLVPKVTFSRKVKLDADGTARIAKVSCPEGRCRIIAPKRLAFRLKGKKFTPGVKSPRGWYRERSSEVMLITSAGTRRVVRNHGPTRVRLKLTVQSDNGKRRTVTRTVTLIAGRR